MEKDYWIGYCCECRWLWQAQCRRHAPLDNNGWVEVEPDDWCGDYQQEKRDAKDKVHKA